MSKTACQNLARVTFGNCLQSAYLASSTSIFISPDSGSPDFSPVSYRPIGIKFDMLVLLINVHRHFLCFPKFQFFFQQTYNFLTTEDFKKNLPLPRFGFSRFFTTFPSCDWDIIWVCVFFSSMPMDIYCRFPKIPILFRKNLDFWNNFELVQFYTIPI